MVELEYAKAIYDLAKEENKIEKINECFILVNESIKNNEFIDLLDSPKLTKEEAKLNWNNPAQVIHNLVRGLMPAPKAFFIHNDMQIKVLKTTIQNETTDKPAGTILTPDLKIACQNGEVIKIEELQKSGGKPLTTKDFTNGYKFTVGEVLK